MIKPRIVQLFPGIWHCRSREYWGVGKTVGAAWDDWLRCMNKIRK